MLLADPPARQKVVRKPANAEPRGGRRKKPWEKFTITIGLTTILFDDILRNILEGVDTAEQQVEIAARKAGLGSLEGVALQRFGVTRYREQDAVTGRLPILS